MMSKKTPPPTQSPSTATPPDPAAEPGKPTSPVILWLAGLYAILADRSTVYVMESGAWSVAPPPPRRRTDGKAADFESAKRDALGSLAASVKWMPAACADLSLGWRLQANEVHKAGALWSISKDGIVRAVGQAADLYEAKQAAERALPATKRRQARRERFGRTTEGLVATHSSTSGRRLAPFGGGDEVEATRTQRDAFDRVVIERGDRGRLMSRLAVAPVHWLVHCYRTDEYWPVPEHELRRAEERAPGTIDLQRLEGAFALMFRILADEALPDEMHGQADVLHDLYAYVVGDSDHFDLHEEYVDSDRVCAECNGTNLCATCYGERNACDACGGTRGCHNCRPKIDAPPAPREASAPTAPNATPAGESAPHV